jgi:hypothetical protein
VKTTEVFVEQVLIGALVLGAAALPWWPDAARLFVPDGVAGLGGGLAAVGLAYLLGILCDRLADTLTEDLERHQRLRFALGWPTLRAVARPAREGDWTDPFPEDALRLAVLRDSEPVVAWLDYHRSRVRLTRALAVFLPAAAFAAVLGAARLAPPAGVGPEWVALVPLIYGLVAWRGWRRRQQSGEPGASRPAWPLAPKTYRPQAYDYGHDQGFTADDDASRRRRWHSLVRVLLADPAVQGAALLHATAIVVAVATGRGAILGLALLGAGLTAMSGWSWWRISATYRHYLGQAGRTPPGHPSH